MTSQRAVELAHAPQDVGVADYLANDLARQGVAISRDPVPGGPLVLVVGPASAADSALQAAADKAAQAGRPIHVVRLGEGHYGWPSLHAAESWTDAHGAGAQANVAALAARLRDPAQPPATSPWGSPSPSPWGGAPVPTSPAPSPWGHPPATASEPPSFGPAGPVAGFSPGPPPVPPASGTEPSDRGSLIALFVVGGLGLVLLLLYLTGALNFGSGAPAGSGSTTGRPATGASAGGVTDQWLTGTWKENCAASEFVRFDLARGTATFRDGAGRVTRSGETLTISGGGGSIVMTVAYVDQDRMRATAQGDTQLLVRCG